MPGFPRGRPGAMGGDDVDTAPVTLSGDSISALAAAIWEYALRPDVAARLVSVYAPLIGAWVRPWVLFMIGMFAGAVGAYVVVKWLR